MVEGGERQAQEGEKPGPYILAGVYSATLFLPLQLPDSHVISHKQGCPQAVVRDGVLLNVSESCRLPLDAGSCRREM